MKPTLARPADRGRRYGSLDELFAAVRERCLFEFERRMGKPYEPGKDYWAPRKVPSASEREARRVFEELRRAYRKAKRIADAHGVKQRECHERNTRGEGLRFRDDDPTVKWLAAWVRRVDANASRQRIDKEAKRTSIEFDRLPWDHEKAEQRLVGRVRFAWELCNLVAFSRLGRGRFGVFDNAEHLRSLIPTSDRHIAVVSLLKGHRPSNITKANTVSEAIIAETKAMRQALAREMRDPHHYIVNEDAMHDDGR